MRFSNFLLSIAAGLASLNAYADVRREASFPDIPGYYTLLGDFHVHTTFSDATTWPTERIDEAVYDGTNVLSITDHVDTKLQKQTANGILDKNNVDRNTSYEIAKRKGDIMNVIVVHGGELSRGRTNFPGHFNTHFISDGNAVYKAAEGNSANIKDPVKREETAIRDGLTEAKKQNAFIVWNHPYWERQAPNGPKWLPFYQELLDKGLLHGIEVANHDVSDFIDPWAFHWAMEKNLTIVSGTDCHRPMYRLADIQAGAYRNETLLFVKEKTEAGVREALENHRTLVCVNGCLYGKEELLTAMFKRMFEISDIETPNPHRVYLTLTNRTTMPIEFEKAPGNENISYPLHVLLHPGEIMNFCIDSADYRTPIKPEDIVLKLKIGNFFTDVDKALTVSVKLIK